MFCPQCGKPVKDDDLICKNCGFLLKKYDTPQTAMNDNTVHAKPKKEETIAEMFFSTKGRLNRQPYILRILGLNLIEAFIMLVGILAYGTFYQDLMPEAVVDEMRAWMGLIMLFPCAMLMIRRLHDLNRSGWWFLIILIPYVNFLLLIAALFIKGTKGPNKYGPDPLQAESQETK